MLAALYARVLGAVPIVVDPIDERLAAARALGITFGINPERENAVGRIREITHGRLAMISRTISSEEAPDAVREIATYPEKFMKVVALMPQRSVLKPFGSNQPSLAKGLFPFLVQGRKTCGDDGKRAQRQQRGADRTCEKHGGIAAREE